MAGLVFKFSVLLEHLILMGRNSRWPTRSNHGARPCSSVMRRMRKIGFYHRRNREEGDLADESAISPNFGEDDDEEDDSDFSSDEEGKKEKAAEEAKEEGGDAKGKADEKETKGDKGGKRGKSAKAEKEDDDKEPPSKAPKGKKG